MSGGGVEGPLPLSEVVAIWRRNRAAAEREFYAEVYAEKRERIDVNLWRQLPDAGPEG
ncbi:hypothetical protein ACFYU5_34885 [Nocardia aobensis]|uniref:Uncharacterized protein n=1 Tax=Nocardia aobensis TaxID=257277 RepID=A0ABW6PEL1_9NOCA